MWLFTVWFCVHNKCERCIQAVNNQSAFEWNVLKWAPGTSKHKYAICSVHAGEICVRLKRHIYKWVSCTRPCNACDFICKCLCTSFWNTGGCVLQYLYRVFTHTQHTSIELYCCSCEYRAPCMSVSIVVFVFCFTYFDHRTMRYYCWFGFFHCLTKLMLIY